MLQPVGVLPRIRPCQGSKTITPPCATSPNIAASPPGTVCRVLQGHPQVAAATREKVQAAAEAVENYLSDS